MLTDKLFKNRGSITVEASLVFPLVVLIVFGVMYISMLLYQQSYAQAVADSAACYGAAAFNNSGRDIETCGLLQKDLSRDGIYWRLYDSKKRQKQDKTGGYVDRHLDEYNILNGIQSVDVEIQDMVVYKKLRVNIECRHRIPIGRLLKLVGMSEYYTIHTEAEAVLNDQAEFIRNTDFIIDLEKELENGNPEVKKLGDNVRGIIKKIQGKAIDIFGIH